MKLFVKLSLIALMSFSWGAFAVPKEVTVEFSGPVPFVPPPGSNYSDSILVDPTHRVDLSCYQSMNGGGFTLLAQCPIINNALAMSSSTWAPFSSIVNTLSFSPQATSLSFVISGTVGPKSLYERNLLTVNVVLNNSTTLRYDFDNPSAVFSYPITISKPDGISVAGITILYNRNLGGTIGDPGYYYHTGIGTLTWATDVKRMGLLAEVIDAPATPGQNDVLITEVEPSLYKCSQLSEPIVKNKRKIKVTCVDLDTLEPTEKCLYRVDLFQGPDDGGHTKVHSGKRNLGVLSQTYPGNNYVLMPSRDGVRLELEIPEVSGDIDLMISGKDYNMNPLARKIVRMRVKKGDFVNLSGTGIIFDTNDVYDNQGSLIEEHSHATGKYGTLDMFLGLQKLVKKFNSKFGTEIPPKIRSQAASLPLGGVYDINLNWKSPHCTHRDGINLDISLSSFASYTDLKVKKKIRDALNQAIVSSGFIYGKNEGPNDQTNHWHIQLVKGSNNETK